MPLYPAIAPEIFALRPDFTALSIAVEGAANRASDAASARWLAEAIAGLDAAPWAEAHLEAWRDAYRGFGAKPRRTPCSAEALRKRVQRDAYRGFGAKPRRTPCSAEALRKRVRRDGELRPANAVVDLYNAVSLRYAIPVGGEDAARYAGAPTLRRALGTEPFETMAEGTPVTETPEAGEVIWCDATGVTCRRWNWRQGRRTQLTEASHDMWFVLERLEPMPVEAVIGAGRSLVLGLLDLSPGATIAAAIIDQSQPEGRTIGLGG